MESHSFLPIYNEDCISGSVKHFEDGVVDLFVNDPPFGINESTFDRHYNRDESNVIAGYEEAPSDYAQFTQNWMSAAYRMLSAQGSMFVIIGHTNLRHVLNAASSLGLHEINHIIWKYNFGVNTKTKFVTSHYHVLYYGKHPTKRIFNLNCRFGCQEKDEKGGSLLYRDLEDVFDIKREYAPGEQKNKNKLPTSLVEKLVLYCSNADSVVGDFFLGNFTTAIVAKSLHRKPIGFEKNPAAFAAGVSRLNEVIEGSRLSQLGEVRNVVPANQGQKITEHEFSAICSRYSSLRDSGNKHGKIVTVLCEEFGRGKFSIINVLKKQARVLNSQQLGKVSGESYES
jgi:site-specific DNA-methyltransferase (adenine-specific)